MSNVHGFDFRNREEQNRGANGALGLANGF